MRDGTLGCPVCAAEYAIRDGVTYFAEPDSAREESAGLIPDDALRLAALLNVSEASGTVALVGADVAVAHALQGVVPMRCVIVDPPAPAGTRWTRSARAPLAVLECDGILPVPHGSLDGIFVQHAGARGLSVAVAALRPKGRLVASANAPFPAGVVELARDARHWVAERSADADAAGSALLVQLRRRR